MPDLTPPKKTCSFGLPDDGAWRRSYMRLPATVDEIAGHPVKAYGRTFVYGVSPDFSADPLIQRGALAPQQKLVPKKSWELRENHCGSMVSYQPRLPQNDFQPFLAVYLIDGDAETSWCSRGESQPDVAPAWVRLDLPASEHLTRIVLVPRADGHPWPRELEIKLSCDAWHWTTVYQNSGEAPPAGEPIVVELPENARAKQIWIIANQLPPDKVIADHSFSFAEVQAIDAGGRNVALASRGAGVTASSTNYGYGSTWDYYDLLWPTQYDLGVKWIRLSAGNGPFDYDTLQWRFVEQQRGTYIRDEKTYQAMAEATANGCQIMVILCFSNWLYSQNPEKAELTARTFPTEGTSWMLTTREEFEGYKTWVRFMVESFKGVVACWEILNEPTFGAPEEVRSYCRLVQEVVPVIREVDPSVKISLAGMPGVPGFAYDWAPGRPPDPRWMHQFIDHGMGPLVDAIGWHIQCDVHPGLDGWSAYPEAVKEFKEYAEAAGFTGEYMASEYWIGDPYPANINWGYPPHRGTPGVSPMTEIRKAKDLARTYVMNAGLDVITYYCNTWFETFQNGNGLFRNTFAADPLSPCQPEAAYYLLRTVCTLLDGAEPAAFPVECSNPDRSFDIWTFSEDSGDAMIAIWLPDASADKHSGVETDVIAEVGRCQKVVGIDTLNGIEQELVFEQQGDRVVIPRVVVRDYPLMIKLVSAGPS